MGLAERRAAKEFETNQFPGFAKRIAEAATFDIPIDVQWESLAADGMAHLYAEAWPKVYFEPLIAALTSICADSMGRDALKGAVKRIVIRNTAGIYSGERMPALEAGVLTLDHEPCSNVDDVDERTRAITQHLEGKL